LHYADQHVRVDAVDGVALRCRLGGEIFELHDPTVTAGFVHGGNMNLVGHTPIYAEAPRDVRVALLGSSMPTFLNEAEISPSTEPHADAVHHAHWRKH
jgi:hypothetical protein